MSSCKTDEPLPGYPLVPADVFVTSFVDEDLAIDAAVVHPLPNSLSATATVTAGAAAQAREEAKAEYYAAKCATRGWGFTAFGTETTGAWGPAAQRFFKRLVRVQALHSGEKPEELSLRLRRTLAHAVAHAVGRQLSRGVNTVPGMVAQPSSFRSEEGAASHLCGRLPRGAWGSVQ